MILSKINVNIAIGVAILGLVSGLFISNNREIKKNFKLQKKIENVSRADSLKAVKIKELVSYDSLSRSNIEILQKDFKVYRDSFLLYKKSKLFNDRIITINKVQKCLSKKITVDTLIINKKTYETK